MRCSNLFVRAALCTAVAAMVGCGTDDPTTSTCPDNCLTSVAPAATCDGDTRVTYSPIAFCSDDGCVHAEQRSNCAEDGGTCEAGACVAAAVNPCDTITCDAPPADACEGNALVTYGAGTCDEALDGCTVASGAGGCCVYEPTTEACPEGDVCVGTRCITPADPCEDVSCDTPPAVTCEGTVLVAYDAAGTCDPDTLDCSYEATRTDCADTDQFCGFGRCQDTDPCDGVTCNEPPGPVCEGTSVVTYVTRGTCDAGDCDYAVLERTNCAATGDLCVLGECVAPGPCVGVVCDRGPTSRCDGTTAYSYPEVGVCNPDTSLCEYDEAVVNCDATGQICDAGACVDPGPCDGVVCDRPPGPYCDGAMVVTSQSPGSCVEATGTCEYGAVMEDCGADGLDCFEGECVADALCVDVTCGTPPPAASCDIDERIATRYVGLSYCDAGDCVWTTETEDCGIIGEQCVAGECEAIDLCAGVTCARDAYCDVNTAVSYAGPGACSAGLCNYTAVEERQNCTLTGLRCSDGACVRPVDLIVEGDIVVSEYMPIPLSGSPEDVWFELTNRTGASLNLAGATVTNNDGTQVMTLPSLPIAPGASVVLAASDTALPAGEVDWSWGGSAVFSLDPAGGAILIAGADTICEVFYNPTDIAYVAGVSGTLDTFGFENTIDTANWCATAREYSPGVFASPGQYGESCSPRFAAGDVAISEIMIRGNVRPGVETEQWIEVFVTGDNPVDLGGLTVENSNGDWFTLPAGLTADERTYAAVAYNGSAGGAGFVGRYQLVVFDEAADTISLSSAGVPVDSVAYDAGWALADGTSVAVRTSLVPDSTNNDAAASYCAESAVYDAAAGNSGTPGAANACE